MAYKKKYQRNKKTYRGKARSKGGILTTKFSAMDVAKAAWNGVKFIKGLVNVERHISVDGVGGVVDNVGFVNRINQIGQGDTNGARTGNSILLKTLMVRNKFSLRLGQSALIRMIVFVDTQQIADASPTVSDLLESDVLGGLERDTIGRFKILTNKVFNIDPANSSTLYNEWYYEFPEGFHQRYNGPSSADIQKNGLYMLYISDVPVGTSSPQYSRNCRLSFYDN